MFEVTMDNLEIFHITITSRFQGKVFLYFSLPLRRKYSKKILCFLNKSKNINNSGGKKIYCRKGPKAGKDSLKSTPFKLFKSLLK